MFIHGIKLKDFRQFSTKLTKFSKRVTIIVGPNGSGKSSILESIRLLSTGSSFRATRVEQMIRFKQDLARVKGEIFPNAQSIKEDLGGLDKLELSLLLTPGELQGKRTRKMLYTVNGNRRRKSDFTGKFLSVLFRPEDLRLVEGSPSRRRNYLNDVLTLTDKRYDRALNKYKKALRRRNKLLSLIKEGEQKPSTLKYWDMAIVKHGEIIQAKRKKFVLFANAQVKPPLDMELIYQPSIITQERLDSHRSGAIGAGYTLIGPHKDDLQINLNLSLSEKTNYQNLELFGSRGQKRLGVLWLKLIELEGVEAKTDHHPVLLLDDILSELDDDSRKLVLNLLETGQCIITSTDQSLVSEIEERIGEEVQVISLKKEEIDEGE